ncbi:glycosyltransferase family 2 protein [Lacticaseibacillus paracasei]|uniref:glycosyltransferase family 2 protein n=1 Tax=Lacticaseibacillus paracasei TaxID=1597 RepID=UPI00192C93B2|nr:glycosyltransferase family 2 protein [Lacticaseibacillus paracasei]CAD7482773.1 dTDP-rhamnosyl transferase RfbF [Lacticaseibacillus paracasei]
MKNRISALVITYNPNLETLMRNVEQLVTQVNDVLIVDNGSRNMSQIRELLYNKKEFATVSILKLSENVGIAKAQNIGFNTLKKNHSGWVLTMDQDSIIPDRMIEKYTQSTAFREPSTGIISCQYVDEKWTEAQKMSKLRPATEEFTSVVRSISSGNLVNVRAWSDVQGFDEYLFIDQVDFDFDAKLLLKNYKIIQLNSVIMTHSVGDVIERPILSKLLLFKTANILSNHPPFREYYIARNTLVVSKRYPEFRRHRFQALVSLIQMRRVLLYSRPKFKKFSAMLQGYIDGIKYNPKKDEHYCTFRDSIVVDRIEGVNREN